jgi:hypothetical protein
MPSFRARTHRTAVIPAAAIVSPPPRRAAGPGCRCPAHGTATPRPWDARTCARACVPVLQDPTAPSLALPAPRPCRARQPREVAATSRLRRGQAFKAFPRAPFGRHTHTHFGTHTRTPSCRTGSGPATPDPAEADAWGHHVSEKEKVKRQPSQRGGEGSRPNPRNKACPSRPSNTASPKMSQPARGTEPAC